MGGRKRACRRFHWVPWDASVAFEQDLMPVTTIPKSLGPARPGNQRHGCSRTKMIALIIGLSKCCLRKKALLDPSPGERGDPDTNPSSKRQFSLRLPIRQRRAPRPLHAILHHLTSASLEPIKGRHLSPREGSVYDMRRKKIRGKPAKHAHHKNWWMRIRGQSSRYSLRRHKLRQQWFNTGVGEDDHWMTLHRSILAARDSDTGVLNQGSGAREMNPRCRLSFVPAPALCSVPHKLIFRSPWPDLHVV